MKHKQNFFPNTYYYKFIYDFKLKKMCYKKNSITTCFSLYGLKVLNACILNSYQLEFVRRKLKRRLRKKSIFWLRLFPQLGRSKKPAQMRMGKGKGKGNFYKWVCNVPAGFTFVEIGVRRKFLFHILVSLKSFVNASVSILLPLKKRILKCT